MRLIYLIILTRKIVYQNVQHTLTKHALSMKRIDYKILKLALKLT